ncbi:hypothetical protein [Cryobacterium aureum]|nr:hypothetical protein [Cryobacterium aureum]
MPTLVIHGDSAAPCTHASIAGSGLALIKDASHSVTISRKEE